MFCVSNLDLEFSLRDLLWYSLEFSLRESLWESLGESLWEPLWESLKSVYKEVEYV